MTRLTDWRLLCGPGITLVTNRPAPYVHIDGRAGLVLSGVDFSLHGGATLYVTNSPNFTVTKSKFGGANYANFATGIIYARDGSTNLTVSYNTIDGGAGLGQNSTLIGATSGGTTTLINNWLKNFPQHALENSATNVPYSVVYKNNLIERGGTLVGAHLNILQLSGNVASTSIDVSYNTFYQTWQATGGEGFQFANNTAPVKNVTFVGNVMIAAPTPGHPVCVSVMVHAAGAENLGTAHDNYFDLTGAYFLNYTGSFVGWKYYNNYNMRTGAILPLS